MHPGQLIVILCMICFCALLAHRMKLIPPIAFLFGGLVLALVPGMKIPHIEPEHMLLLFLPPILMEAAFFTSFREFRANLRPILQLAVGLVIITSVAVAAVVVNIIPGANWALGFVLGAIVSPPDAAAATSALRGAPLPRRIVSILEGESLVNDATGIVLYKIAVATVVAGTFSIADVSIQFMWKASIGIMVGLCIAYLFVRMYPFFREPSVEILSTFIPPYAAYLMAESLHASGVLAVVSCGLLIGWHAPSIFSPKMRMPAEAIWKMVVFFINALAFLLIGLQLPGLILRLDVYNPWFVLGAATAVGAITIIVRFAYCFGMTHLTRWLFPSIAKKTPRAPWQNIFLVSWTGMRGVVTLALAAALPLTLENGEPFPYRDLIIFLSISVILWTLVLQGLTLPWLTDRLTLTFDPQRTQEEWLARVNTARKALETLDELERQDNIHLPALQRIRQHYEERLQSLGDGPNTPLNFNEAPSLNNHPLIQAENRIWQEVLKRERDVLLNMRREFTIDDELMHEMLREMDLLSARFHYHEQPDVSSTATAVERRRVWQRITRRRHTARVA